MLNSEARNGPAADNPGAEKPTHTDPREEWREWRHKRMEMRRGHHFGGLFFALLLVLLGTLFFLNQQGVIVGDRWWQSLLIGLGGISLIDGVVHYFSSGYRWRSYGKFVCGIILIAVGVLFIAGFGQWWPLALTAAGLALLIRFFIRRW